MQRTVETLDSVSRTPQFALTNVASKPQCDVELLALDMDPPNLPGGTFPAEGPDRCFVCPSCGQDGPLGGRCSGCELYYVSARSLEVAPPRSWLGHLLADRFAVLGMLGAGGMGVVYWAVQHPVGRLAAVKVLRSDLTGSVVQERFLREAQTIAGLQHPHVITCFDYGLHADRQPYMALELLHGISLEHAADELSLDLPTVVHISDQILDGVAAFHDAGIVHRDLKPDNVMLCRIGGDDTFVKIIDFGLALRLLDSPSEKLTQAAEVFGTPLFMSPEQAVGSGDVGPQSDVYSFGIMLYELLTGRTPFTGAAAMKVMLKHINDAPPPLVPRAGMEIPPALEAFVLRCLEKDPLTRFANGREALDAFRELGLPNSGPVFVLTGPDDGNAHHNTVAFAQSADLAIDLPNTDTIHFVLTPVPRTRRVIELSWPPIWWDPERLGSRARSAGSQLVRIAAPFRTMAHTAILAAAASMLALVVAIVVTAALWPESTPPAPPEVQAATAAISAAVETGSLEATAAAVDDERKMRDAKERLHH